MDNIVQNFAKISFTHISSSYCTKLDRGCDKLLAKTGKEGETYATTVALPGAFNNMSEARRPPCRSEFDGLISGHRDGVLEGRNQVRLVQFNPRKLKQQISYNDALRKINNMGKKGMKTHAMRLKLKKTTKDDIQDRLNKSLDSAMAYEEEQFNANDNPNTVKDDIMI